MDAIVDAHYTDAINDALSHAVESGYLEEIASTTSLELAIDLGTNCAGLEGCDAEFLVPYIELWKAKRGICDKQPDTTTDEAGDQGGVTAHAAPDLQQLAGDQEAVTGALPWADRSDTGDEE